MVVLASLFCSCFPSAFLTVGFGILYQLFVSIPTNRAIKQILLESEVPFLTEAEIARQLAKKHPKLYNLRAYFGLIIIAVFIAIYVLSTLVFMLIGLNTTVQTTGFNL